MPTVRPTAKMGGNLDLCADLGRLCCMLLLLLLLLPFVPLRRALCDMCRHAEEQLVRPSRCSSGFPAGAGQLQQRDNCGKVWVAVCWQV
jgi:hypothetical protein